MAASLPPWTIAELREIIRGEMSFAGRLDTTVGDDRIDEQCFLALQDIQQTADWDFLVKRATINVTKAGTTLPADFSRMASDGLSYNDTLAGNDAFIRLVTAKEWSEENRAAAALDSPESQCYIAHVEYDSSGGTSKLYGGPQWCTVEPASAQYQYIREVYDDTATDTTIYMPAWFADLWYLASLVRVHLHLSRDKARADLAQGRFDAKLAAMRPLHDIRSIPPSGGASGGSGTESDGISENISDQLYDEIDKIEGLTADREVCDRAVRRAFRSIWNAFNWNFRWRMEGLISVKDGDSLPADFDSSFSGASIFSTELDKYYPFVAPDQYARIYSTSVQSSAVEPWTAVWDEADHLFNLRTEFTVTGALFYRASAPDLITTTAPADLPEDFYEAWHVRARHFALQMHAAPEALIKAALETWDTIKSELAASVNVFSAAVEDVDSRFTDDTPDGIQAQVEAMIRGLGKSVRRGACDAAVVRAFREVWMLRPWRFRQKLKTDLSLTSGGGPVDLPADFAGMCENSRLGAVDGDEIAVMDLKEFTYQRARTWSGTTPKVACIESKQSLTGSHVQYQIRYWPSSATLGSVYMAYLVLPPALSDTTVPVLPAEFRNAWYALACYYATLDHPDLAPETVVLCRDTWEKIKADLESVPVEVLPESLTLTDTTTQEVIEQVKINLRQMGADVNHQQIARHIRHGFRDVWTAHPWSFRIAKGTMTVASGTATLPDAARFTGVLRDAPITNSAGLELYLVSPDQFAARQHDADVTATNPIITFLFDETTGQWSASVAPATMASTTFDLFYLTNPPDSPDSTYERFPVEFQRYWILRATLLALTHLPKPVESQAGFEANWKEFLDSPNKLDHVAADLGIEATGNYQAKHVAAELMADLRGMGVMAARNIVTRNVKRAFTDVWMAHPWSFRVQKGTLIVNGATVTLPDSTRFCGVLPNAPIVNSAGLELLYLTPDQFAARRYDADVASAKPIITFIWDETTGAWTGSVAPTTLSSTNFDLYYLTTPGLPDATHQRLPDEFQRYWLLRAILLTLQGYADKAGLLETKTADWNAFLAAPEKLEHLSGDVGIEASDAGQLGELTAELMGDLRSMGLDPQRATVKRTAKRAFRELWNMYEWSFRRRRKDNLSVTAGSTTATTETDFGLLNRKVNVYAVKDYVRYPIAVVPYNNLQALQSGNLYQTRGAPLYMAVDWDSTTDLYILHFEPPLDGTYVVHYGYFAKAPTLTDGTNADIPPDFREAWYVLAKLWCLEGVKLTRGIVASIELTRDRWRSIREQLRGRDLLSPRTLPYDATGDLGRLAAELN